MDYDDLWREYCMIEVRLADSKDKDSWNAVVTNSNNGTFFHTWEWIDTINNGLGEKTLPILAEVRDNVVGIFPLFTRSILNPVRTGSIESKIRHIHQLFPYVSNKFEILWSPYPNTWGYGGPCVVTGEEDYTQKIYDNLYEYTYKICKDTKSITDMRISLFNCTPFDQAIVYRDNYTSNERQTSLIDLTLDESILWKNLKKDSHRNAINQANRKGVMIREANRELDYIEFYKLIKDLEFRTGVPADPLEYYLYIYKNLMPKGMARLFLAEVNNIIIGGLINFYYSNMVFLGHMSFPREYSKYRANNLIIWHTILDSKGKGFKILDLTGMPHDNNHGIYRFKSGFGSTLKHMKVYRKKFRYIHSRKFLKHL